MEQFVALRKMEHFIENLQIFGGKDADGKELFNGGNRYEWTHGIRVQIKALKALYYEMVEHGPLDYILTTRCNQDCLENYFSMFRSIGGDDTKPGPVQTMSRIRNLLFTKNAEFVVKNPSVRIEKNEETEEAGDEVDLDEFDEFEQEDKLVTSLQRFTDDIHTIDRPLEQEVPAEEFEYPDNVNVPEVLNLGALKYPEEEVGKTVVVKVPFHEYKKRDFSFQALTYILGSIAKKLRDSHPQLASPTAYFTQADKEESLCTWILSISQGRLNVPSDEFILDGQVMEEEFNMFHAGPKRVDMQPWVIDRFTDKLLSIFKDRYDREVLQLFSVTRTHIRIKDLNKELKNKEREKLGMRDYKQLGQLQNYKLPDFDYTALAREFLNECDQ